MAKDSIAKRVGMGILKGTGKGLWVITKLGSKVLYKTGKTGGKFLYNHRKSIAKTTGKILGKSGKTIQWGVKKVYDNKEKIYKGTKTVAKAIATTATVATAAVIGAGKFGHDAASKVIYNGKKNSELKSEVEKQSKLYKVILERKKPLIDSGIVSGALVADILSDKTVVPVKW